MERLAGLVGTLAVLAALAHASASQPADADAPTYAERLGWPKGARVVIFHVDDAGMSRDSNQGVIEATSQGVATSASIMMPCPWVPEMVAYAKAHPELDAGLHLTLNAEWKKYRWVPLAGAGAVPGLVDDEGCLHRDPASVARLASPEEVDREIRAQLDRARRMGLRPTHLDTHMGTVMLPKFIESYARLGIEASVPVMMPAGHMRHVGAEVAPQYRAAFQQLAQQIWQAGLPLIDDLVTNPTKGETLAERKAYLLALLRDLRPGVTQMIVHCTRPTEVFQHISGSGEKRLHELQLMTDPDLRRLLDEQGIELTTWRELYARRQAAPPAAQ
jgi:predicted glycoside hydrolase/deacetylase ChbG (UPF0249 family)